MACAPLLLAFVTCSLIGQSSGQTFQQAADLKSFLFNSSGYDVDLRPIQDQGDTIYIYVEFFLLALNGVDERAETLKTTGYLSLYWDDQLLVWDPALYGNLNYYFFPQNDVWKPDVALKNSYLDYKQLGDKSLKVQVFNNGEVRWSPFQVFQSTCSIDITNFPFDEQTCELTFVAWSYTKDEVFMEGGAKGIVLEEFEANSAWDVADTSWHTKWEQDESSIVFVIKLKRKPLYNLLTLVFPIIMLGILNLFVFLLPCESGEKAGYAVTVFLAFAVFLTIMEASFPQNSETVAYFANYVVVETVQSTVITLISLGMIRVHFFDESTKIPRWLIFLTRIAKCKVNRRSRKDANKVGATQNSTTKLTLQDIDENNDKLNRSHDGDEPKAESEYTWKYVANAMDTIFFVLFGLSFLVTTLGCMLLAQFG